MKNNILFIVISFFSLQNFCCAQPGTIDATFDAGTGFNGVVNTIKHQSDAKIIVGGDFTNFGGTPTNRITRLNANGAKDTSFSVGTGCNGGVQNIALQADGKIILVGLFTTYNSTSKKYILRLNSDGSLDTTFAIGTAANFPILAVAVQNDGKIIIGGGFTTFNGTAINRIVRLNTNGSIDTSFAVGIGADNSISTIAIQPDGKIIIGGEFTNYNGTLINRLARLNADGSLDSSFTIGTGANNAVYNAQVLPDSKILIAGLFTAYNATTKNYVTKLNADGSIDSAFDIGIGANNAIRAIACQVNDKIILGGNFNTFNSYTHNRVLRISPTGTIDATFLSGSGANNAVNALAIQPDGDIILAGNFTTFNGTSANRILRIKGDTVLNTIDFNTATITLYPNPASEILHLDYTTQNQIDKLEILDTSGRTIASKTGGILSQINVSDLSEGMYTLVLHLENTVLFKKFLKKNN